MALAELSVMFVPAHVQSYTCMHISHLFCTARAGTSGLATWPFFQSAVLWPHDGPLSCSVWNPVLDWLKTKGEQLLKSCSLPPGAQIQPTTASSEEESLWGCFRLARQKCFVHGVELTLPWLHQLWVKAAM